MAEKVVDRRVRKTKALLISGLIELLKTKPVNEITVRELSELVDINRGTFYLHYKDIFDMVEQLENDLYEEFLKGIGAIPRKTNYQQAIMSFVFSFVEKNNNICKILLFDNGSMTFVNKFVDAIHIRCEEDWGEMYGIVSREEFMYIDTFLEVGVLGIVKQWLDNGMVQSVEKMGQLAADLFTHVTKMINVKK